MILNYQQCLDKLSKIKMITINGVPTQIKEVPELTKGLDPRVKIQRLKPKVEFSKLMIRYLKELKLVVSDREWDLITWISVKELS